MPGRTYARELYARQQDTISFIWLHFGESRYDPVPPSYRLFQLAFTYPQVWDSKVVSLRDMEG